MAPVITKEMSLTEVLSIDQSTAAVFMDFGMTCLGCPFSRMETIEQACAGHGVNADELVDRLNEYLAGKPEES